VTDRPPPPLVEVDGLTFRYRRASQPAIRDVSLTVAPGEVVLVAGPSGCGKSTLIRAINGLIPHAYSGDLTGTVRVGGQATSEVKLRDLALTVGTVLQDPAKQIVGATVESELAFGPENMGIPREEIRERIREVAAQAGIERLLGRETHALSGGERQLLAVAGILMLRPRLFVVDEPLANLDPATAERLLVLLRSLADEGSAIVIVEHRVEESLDLRPDRVLYLEDGSTRYLGPVDGFLEIADPESVKLPFEVVARRVAAGSPDEEPTALTLGERQGDALDTPARLEFQGVTAAIDEHEILHGVDARLDATETIAVLGPNGSGKTTIMRMLTGFFAPTAGTCSLGGIDVTVDPREARRRIGYLPERVALYPDMTVRGFLAFIAKVRGVEGRVESAVGDAMEVCGLTSMAGRHIGKLSKGYRQRVGIAQAIIHQPQVLILDEPTVGLDPEQRMRFREVIAELGERRTVLLSTHQTEEVMALCQRVIVLDRGTVRFEGQPGELADLAAGRVWTSGAREPGALASWRTGSGLYRHVGDPPPGADLVTPTVEDGYLLFVDPSATHGGEGA
jgi:ABC-type multidrug transport system ATPase subunit